MLEQTKGDGRLLRWVLARRFAFALLFITLAGSGCTTAWIREHRLAPTGLAFQDTIAVIVTSPLQHEHFPELENTVMGCIQDALPETYSDVRIIPSDEFRKLAVPDPAIETNSPGDVLWQSLLRDPAFHDRIAPLGLRYLIVVSIEERTRLTDFEWMGVASIGGPSLDWSWERSVLMEVIVVDARHRRVAGFVQAYATGKSGAGVMLVTFPIPLPVPYGTASFPLSVACQGLGEGLAKFLTDGSPAEEQAAEQGSN
ncbi:MAG: hypothetical protein ACE5JO_04910 [Candidatus Binatia bacterium]